MNTTEEIFSRNCPDAINVLGGNFLNGSVNIPGDKVTAAHLLLGSLVLDNDTTIENIHLCGDVVRLLSWMEASNIAEVRLLNNSVKISPIHNKDKEINLSSIADTRSNICLISPLALNYGQAVFAGAGGCSFTERKIDLHFKLAKACGIKISKQGNHYLATKKSKPKKIKFNCATKYGPSVGVTCHALIASMLLDCEILLKNTAQEPVTKTLIQYVRLGASKDIQTSGKTIHINPSANIKHRPITIRLPIDLTVAFTYMAAAIICGGNISLRGVNRLPTFFQRLLRSLNVSFKISTDYTRIKAKPGQITHPGRVVCDVWPGFPTDMGPILAAALTKTEGTTLVIDKVYDKRSSHVDGLNKMGYNLKADGNKITVVGSTPSNHNNSITVKAPDIRSGAALLVGALGRSAKTTITNYWQIYRGHANITNDLKSLGATIRVVQ